MTDNFQQRLEEEQAKNKSLLGIINAISDPIMVKDRHGKYLFANKGLADLYNTVPHKLIGKDDTYFTGNIAQTKVYTESVQTVIQSKKQQVVYEDATDLQTGETHNYRSLKIPFVNTKGEDNVVIIAADITDVVTLKKEAEKNKKKIMVTLDAYSEGMYEWAPQTNEVFYNTRLETITGVGNVNNSFEEYQRCILDDDKAKVNKAQQKLLEANIAYSIEYRMLRPSDNKQIWISDRAAVLEYNEQGEPLWIIGIIQDITARKLLQEKLKLAASVFTHACENIIITDVTGTIIDVNKAFTGLTGYSHEEAIGNSLRMLESGRHPPEFYDDLDQTLLKEGLWSGEIWSRRKNGDVYAEMRSMSAVCDEQGIITHYIALGSDITQIKEHQSQLEHIAHYDTLTHLPNRVLLSDRLSHAMLQCNRHKQSLAVAFLDLDGFKAVNDTYGHSVGDELLIAISIRMKEALREGDSLARFGGDEFIVVLADLVNVDDCKPVLERLLLAASEPITVGDVVFNVSASIGVTLYPQDNLDADKLIRHADQAMYVAKQLGKSRYHLFDKTQDEAVKVKQASLAAIRSALANQQFVLYYQPKVNMRTGRVVGFEALIRWQHPEKGLLTPDNFLPVIENHPMSIEIGEWVIDSALAQISQWQAMGLNLPLSTSVNIGAVQLQQPDFAQRLSTLLAGHPDVEPRYLSLEVLETSAIHDVQHVSTIMNACMALGVNFALDDFGTGYSSLTYLRQLPATVIKIDRSFVQDMLIDGDDLAIIQGVIALAHSFKREVIAEGVETIEHGTALLQLGCELAQGYGIARPMPASEIAAWVSDWTPDVRWKK